MSFSEDLGEDQMIHLGGFLHCDLQWLSKVSARVG